MAKKPLTYPEFIAIYSKVPRLCVDLVIQNSQGQVLLTLRKKYGYEGLWHTPGGTMHFHQSIKTTINRIAREELGVRVKMHKFLGLAEFLNERINGQAAHGVSLFYLCSIKDDAKIVLDDQAEDYRFFAKLPKNHVPEQKKFILDVLQQISS